MSIGELKGELGGIYKDLVQGNKGQQKIAKNKIKALTQSERDLAIEILAPKGGPTHFDGLKLEGLKKKLEDLKVKTPKHNTGPLKKISRAFQNWGPNRISSQQVIDAMKTDSKKKKIHVEE